MSAHPPINEDLMRLNESLKNAQIALGTTENAKRSLELKLKQTEDKASHSEIRQVCFQSISQVQLKLKITAVWYWFVSSVEMAYERFCYSSSCKIIKHE